MSPSVCIVERSIENFVPFWIEFNVLEFEWLRKKNVCVCVCVFYSMVHCCYDFRLKLLECLIENFEHFRFEFYVGLTSKLATRARLSTLWNVYFKFLCIFGTVERCRNRQSGRGAGCGSWAEFTVEC